MSRLPCFTLNSKPFCVQVPPNQPAPTDPSGRHFKYYYDWRLNHYVLYLITTSSIIQGLNFKYFKIIINIYSLSL